MGGRWECQLSASWMVIHPRPPLLHLSLLQHHLTAPHLLHCHHLVSLILYHAAATARVNVRAPGVVGADAAQGDMGPGVLMIVSGVQDLGARIHL